MSKSKEPLVYLRRIDHSWIAVITGASGKRIRRGTGLRNKESAQQFATLLQDHVRKAAEDGHILPPVKSPSRRRKKQAAWDPDKIVGFFHVV